MKPSVVIKVHDNRYDGNARLETFEDYNEAFNYFLRNKKAYNFFCLDNGEWYHTREDFFKAKILGGNEYADIN